jgi:Xaa-Pro aminopeptidase
MKSDLDRLMAERDIDAIVVEGPDGLESANPDYNYFVGGRHLPGLVLKRRGEPAMLVHGVMERQQAAETGLHLIPRDRWNIREIRASFPNPFEAQVEYRRRMFTDLGIRGRVAFYGSVKAGPHYALLSALAQQMPDLEIVAEFAGNIIDTARATKDADEIAAMRRVGIKTAEVVQVVVDMIRAGVVRDDLLFDTAGAPITIGRVKETIRRELAARHLEAPHTIFAQGSDAGLPHAQGNEAEQLRLGTAIVFDIFPREPGGYYHDMTRTFAIGYAPPELQAAYDQVMGAFEKVVSELEMGAPTRVYQELVCSYFEELGHPTIGSTYPLEEGFVHSLGHGLGLEVHEDPRMSTLNDRGEVLAPGTVVTIEPGLYYPSRGFGIRVEDTYYCTPDGRFESLTDFPKDLVIPISAS